MRLQSSCCLGLQSPLRASLGLEDPPPTSLTWQPTGDFSFWPHGSPHRGAHDMVADFPWNEWCEKEKEREPSNGSHVLFNLILEVIYFNFYHILLVAQTNPDTAWERTIHGCEWQEVGITDRSSWSLDTTYCYKHLSKNSFLLVNDKGAFTFSISPSAELSDDTDQPFNSAPLRYSHIYTHRYTHTHVFTL